MSLRKSPRNIRNVIKKELVPVKEEEKTKVIPTKRRKINAVKKEEEEADPNLQHVTLVSTSTTKESSLLKMKGKERIENTPVKNKDWQVVYKLIQAYREKEKAPVDTMGCERLAETTASPLVQRFQTLVSLMLSSQTKDTVTSATVWRLQAELPGGLNLQSILDVKEDRLDELISSVGFHKRKAAFLKRTAIRLRDDYGGDIPDTIQGLTSLPGVGPKMAYLTLQVAWNKNIGIGVDVHVHRICNRLGWVKTKTPEETRASLESWLPKDRWRNINPMMVGFGQIVCLPRGPRCDQCPVNQYCPSAVITKKKKTSISSIKKESLEW